jgi:hypothetical protein
MANEFDIFNPHISTVAKGLDGKIILIYGTNSTGKTKQATRMEKPFYLGFEAGINAIAGIPFLPINKWSDFKKINKQLTDPRTLSKAKENYQTIIFDEVWASAQMAERFIVQKYGAEHIGEQAPQGESRPNLYKEYEKEYWDEFTKLTKAGYTVVFIGHEAIDNDTKQIIPKGDKRSMQVVRDNADITVYLKSNGVDEEGKVIKSSGYTAQTSEYFARSRFDYLPTIIEEFTAENLESAIIEAIEKEEEINGTATVSYEAHVANHTSEVLDFNQLKTDIQNAVTEYAKTVENPEDLQATIVKITDKHLGKGRTLKEVTEDQVEQLSLILDDVNDLNKNH